MSEEIPFTAPILHVWATDKSIGGLIENPQLKEFGGHTFIVGTVVTEGARNGLTLWISLDAVAGIAEYPDKARADAVSAEYKAWEKKKAKRGWWGSRS